MQPHTKQSADIPKWSALLVEAVNKPGLIMKASSAFHNYSIGNQILALVQCQLRGPAPGPINTFPGWQALGRKVKRGERALMLCMPITRKVSDAAAHASEEHELTFRTFVYKPRWFVISQTLATHSYQHVYHSGTPIVRFMCLALPDRIHENRRQLSGICTCEINRD